MICPFAYEGYGSSLSVHKRGKVTPVMGAVGAFVIALILLND